MGGESECCWQSFLLLISAFDDDDLDYVVMSDAHLFSLHFNGIIKMLIMLYNFFFVHCDIFIVGVGQCNKCTRR